MSASRDALHLTEKPPRKGLSPLVKFGVPIVVVAVVLAAVLGGVLGSRAANKSNKSVAAGDVVSSRSSEVSSSSVASSSSSASSTSSQSSSTSSTTTSSAPAATPTGNLIDITPLPQWIWGTDKALGMCLGNWLLLERWMSEDWFIATAGGDAWDEWDFSQVLGDNATNALQDHYNTWIVESDLDVMAEYGVNHLRVPMGFWAWIPTVAGEPYVNASQVAQLEKLMGWAYARKMYIIIDLHGLPGSQNGEESSGHNTTTPSWFGNTVNQARSDTLVKTVTDWLGPHPYRSVISAIEPGNEFRPYTAEQEQEMSDFYSRSYATIQASAWPVAMGFHPGYYSTTPLVYWEPFAAARVSNPPSLFYTDHPYPGNFPPQTGASSILSQVCAAANKYLGFPVPVTITEYSLYTGVKTDAFEKTFLASQITAWSWSGGAFYWSYKLIPSQLQLQGGLDYSQYSFITLINNGTDAVPQGNTTTRDGAASYLSSLDTNCGAAPDNVAPYASNSAAVPTWTAEVNALSSAATVTLQATAPARHRRSFKA